MAANLNVTRYRNGDAVPNVTDNTTWVNLTTGAYCNYENDPSNASTYGHLYNWFAVADSRNIAPVGWHVPTAAEWQTLEVYLGNAEGGGNMKEAGTDHWMDPNTGADNSSGFSALPGGYRNSHLSEPDNYSSLGYSAFFWSSSESIDDTSKSVGFWLSWDSAWGVAYVPMNKAFGISVRLVRD
jgi:uncharacterized protein (TIGR02145 family)